MLKWKGFERKRSQPIETLSLELSGDAEEDQKPRRFNRWDSNRAHPEHKAEISPLPICTVILVVIQTVIVWANTVQSGSWVSYSPWNTPATTTIWSLLPGIERQWMLFPTYQTTRCHNEEHGTTFHSHYFCRTSNCLFNDGVKYIRLHAPNSGR